MLTRTGWALANLDPCVQCVDGIPTRSAGPLDKTSAPPIIHDPHPNGVVGVDHLVMITDDIGRSIDALDGLGLRPLRRTDKVRKGVTQVIFRPGHTILELVCSTRTATSLPSPKSSLWGLTLVTRDIEHTHAYLKHSTKPPWPAVQPGRQITVLKSKGVSVAVAFISKHVKGLEGKGRDREKILEKRAREQEEILRDRDISRL